MCFRVQMASRPDCPDDCVKYLDEFQLRPVATGKGQRERMEFTAGHRGEDDMKS